MEFLVNSQLIMNDLVDGLGEVGMQLKADSETIFPIIAIAIFAICCIVALIPPLRKIAKDNMFNIIVMVVLLFSVTTIVNYAMKIGKLMG